MQVPTVTLTKGTFTMHGGPMDTLASDQLSTNLMVSILSHLHPSAYVHTETSAMSFVLAHVKGLVMTAFANAIDRNVTHTDALEKALRELFVDTPDHVAFCSEPALTTLTMDPQSYANEQQCAERLAQPVQWDRMPIVNGEAVAPLLESQDAMRIRRRACYVWDPFLNTASVANDTDTNKEGQRDRAADIHPMRSFSPASKTAGAGPPGACAIHSGVDRAA